jgi:hypothetical protein
MKVHLPYLAIGAVLLTNCVSSRTANKIDPVTALSQLALTRRSLLMQRISIACTLRILSG